MSSHPFGIVAQGVCGMTEMTGLCGALRGGATTA
jgi:hypothetical protein